jgi:hypothetical protein
MNIEEIKALYTTREQHLLKLFKRDIEIIYNAIKQAASEGKKELCINVSQRHHLATAYEEIKGYDLLQKKFTEAGFTFNAVDNQIYLSGWADG